MFNEIKVQIKLRELFLKDRHDTKDKTLNTKIIKTHNFKKHLYI